MTTETEVKKPNVGGRPRKEFTEEQRIEVLRRISKGEPLVYILAKDGMPCETFFYEYLLKNSGFTESYREAKGYQANAYADKSLLEVLTTHSRVKEEIAVKNEVQSAKNLADEYKWQAAKLAPTKYGRLEQEEAIHIKKAITVTFEGVSETTTKKDD